MKEDHEYLEKVNDIKEGGDDEIIKDDNVVTDDNLAENNNNIQNEDSQDNIQLKGKAAALQAK